MTIKLFGAGEGQLMRRALSLVAALGLLLIGCEMPPATPDTQLFTQLGEQSWGSWTIYVLRHNATGACFVVIDPSGEGGGSVTQADKAVCDGGATVERPAASAPIVMPDGGELQFSAPPQPLATWAIDARTGRRITLTNPCSEPCVITFPQEP